MFVLSALISVHRRPNCLFQRRPGSGTGGNVCEPSRTRADAASVRVSPDSFDITAGTVVTDRSDPDTSITAGTCPHSLSCGWPRTYLEGCAGSKTCPGGSNGNRSPVFSA